MVVTAGVGTRESDLSSPGHTRIPSVRRSQVYPRWRTRRPSFAESSSRAFLGPAYTRVPGYAVCQEEIEDSEGSSDESADEEGEEEEDSPSLVSSEASSALNPEKNATRLDTKPQRVDAEIAR